MIEHKNPPAVPLLPAQNPPRTSIYEFAPFFTLFRSLWKFLTRKADELHERPPTRMHKPTPAESGENLPLDILLFLSSYVSRLQQRKILDVPTTTALMNSLNVYSETLTALEVRVLNLDSLKKRADVLLRES